MNHEATFSQFTADLRQFISDSIQRTEDLSARNDRFNRLALRLFALQFAANLSFRRFCEAANRLPDSIGSWRDIPAVPAFAFKDGLMTCLEESKRERVFCSSGTTGTRASRHYHSSDSLKAYESSLWPWFKAHLLPECGDAGNPPALVILAPRVADAPNSSLAHMFEHIREQLGSPADVFMSSVSTNGSWVVPFERTISALEKHTKAATPVLLLGTAFSFVHFLDDLKRHRGHVQLPAGSRLMETGGYKGRSRSMAKAELHALLSEMLGLDPAMIVSEYGMSELSSQAYNGVAGAPRREPFQFPPWARAQVISPETGLEPAEGNAGLIHVLDLANVYSVMHLQTEDIGRRRANGFELIGRAAAAEPRGCSLLQEPE